MWQCVFHSGGNLRTAVWNSCTCLSPRAAKFGVAVRPVERRPDLRQEARKKAALERRKGPDFVTGIDLFTEVGCVTQATR